MAKWKKRVDGSPAQIGQPYKERARVQHGSARRKGSGTELAPQNRSVESMKKPPGAPGVLSQTKLEQYPASKEIKELRGSQRRIETMQSAEFRAWWEVRSQEDPLPQDPFLAFMIDRGLEARLHGKEPWEKEPNRYDVPIIDFPQRKGKPRFPTLKELKRKRKPPRKLTPKEEKRRDVESEKYQKIADEMCERYRVPKCKVVVVPNPAL